ncbi:MAG: leucine-rich repeat domain-containing protein [Muribaculaceae bacterium]|nr:leucine-rich repeat domain-containing protein [Muribaculaceae bacterium]
MGMTHLHAQEILTVGDFHYQLNGDGVSATLVCHVDGDAVTGEISIPTSISYNGNNYTVTRIRMNAFIGCGKLTGSLTIPNTVTYLGENAFLGCSGLTELDLGNSVDTIGPAAFYGCTGFTGSLTIPNSVRAIHYAAFYGCTGFTGSLTIGNALTRIEAGAFYNCKGFSSLIIGDAVQSIGTSAFWGCTGFTGPLTIPNSVNSIEPNAFHNCSGFNGTLTLGNAVESVGGRAFYHCSGFTDVVSLATTPPVFSFEEVFEGCSCTTLTVPCHCIPAYQNSEWHDYFTTIIEDCNLVPELDEKMANVYPNPTSGTLHIEAENIEAISLYNLLGEKLFETSANGNSYEYDFSPYEAGCYVVRIQTDSGIVTQRVVVNDR